VKPVGGLVFAGRPGDRGAEIGDRGGEGSPRVALVAEDELSADPVGPFEQFDPDLTLIPLGRGEGEGPGCAIGGEEAVQAKTPKEARVRGAVAVVSGVGQGGATRGLHRAGALQRRGVDQQQVIVEAGRLGGEDADQPLDRLGQAGPALVEAGLLWQLGEEIGKALAGDCQKAAIGGDAHDRLGDAEGGYLCVGDPTPGISRLLRQEIVCRAINEGAESVEVGVHRGLSVDGCFSTVDFGLSA